MNQSQIESIGEGMMTIALDNLERDGYVAFAVILVTETGIIPFLLEDTHPQQKERLGDFLRLLAQSGNFLAITIISEAWTTMEHNPLEVSASKHPDRKEAVFVQIASRHGDLLFVTNFDRDKNDKPIRPHNIQRSWQPIDRLVRTNFQGLFARTP